jgi:hypothetical protein
MLLYLPVCLSAMELDLVQDLFSGREHRCTN